MDIERIVSRIGCVLACTLVLICVSPAVAQTGSGLSAEQAIAVLSNEAGRWTGTRETYLNGNQDNPVETRVVRVNRIESNSWLYFQQAEFIGDTPLLTKGTLAFDPESGGFVRRWFENGNAEIKGCSVTFNAAANKFVFSRNELRSGPLPDDAEGNDEVVLGGSLLETTYTTELEIRDSDSRVVRVYSKAAELDEPPLLESRLVLTRSDNLTAAKVAENTTDDTAEDSEPSTSPNSKTDPGHVLLVKVRIASRVLETDQKPDLVIEPADAEPKRISADTFEFSGLKGGVKYKVQGSYQMEYGFRLLTVGEVSHEFDEAAKTKITKTKILTLENK